MDKKWLQNKRGKKKIAASITLPASKSISNRALIIQALSYSLAPIHNLSDCEDTQHLKAALYSNTNHFFTGDGGTTLRFLTAYLSKIVGEWHIDCSERMQQRPVKVLVDALNELGAQITYVDKEGYPPLRILGSNLTKSELELSGSVSSQYITALLLIAPTLHNGLSLKLKGKIVSRPYIEMTLNLMKKFGVEGTFVADIITIPSQQYQFKSFVVEPDWSAASYFYESLCLADEGSLFLQGLSSESSQGDALQVQLWNQLGIQTDFDEKGAQLTKKDCMLTSLEFDFSNMPDLVQTFAVTCCMKGIPFHFTGLETLKIKETNRIRALITELRKLGYILSEEKEGELSWQGERCLPLADISIATYRDHRMAMAFAPVALLYAITIEEPEVVKKSYPDFWKEFAKITD